MALSATAAYSADMATKLSTQTVLITGASSGIGKAFALALAERGADVVLVARRMDRLEALKNRIERDHGVHAVAIAADLSLPDSVAELHAAVQKQGIAVTSLVNNAGFGTWGDFVHEDATRLADEIALDVCAPVQLTHAFLPALLAADHGFLVNVTSMAAYQPTPRMAVYGAAKAFMLSFTESLWAELRGSGLTVFALSPGATSTEFNDVVGTDNATAGARMRSPEDVVGTALNHLRRRNPGPSVIDGQANRAAATFGKFVSRRAAVTYMHRMTDPARHAGASDA